MIGQPFRIGNTATLVPIKFDYIDNDPRGIIWIWEEPRLGAQYVLGCDPSGGITGWDRTLRTQEDEKTDNGAIQVIRIGKDRDYQVAEFAAPLDPEDLADVVNVLGRLYGGNDEDGQAVAIVETNNFGMLTIRRLMNDFGYTNLWQWKYLDSAVPKPTNSVGWYASSKSVPLLWARGARHILRGGLKIRSEALVEEMANAEIDPDKMWAKAIYGQHDDRLRAILLATWAAHEWGVDIETEPTGPISSGEKEPEWQSSDCTAEEMAMAWNDRWNELSD